MPGVVSASITQTANGVNLYQPVGTDGSDIVQGNLTVNGSSLLVGAVNASSTLSVAGATALASTLSVAGATTLTGILNNLPNGSLSASPPATIGFASPANTPSFWSMVISGWRFTWGTIQCAGAAGAGAVPITFATPYGQTPLVLVTPGAALNDVTVANTTFQASTVTPNGFTLIFQSNPAAGLVTLTNFQFLVIGQA